MSAERLIYTSCYRTMKRIPGFVTRVGISRGLPNWINRETFRVEKRLMPTWDMLQMGRGDYDRHFRRILSKADPRQVYEGLPLNCVLLCWEPPNVWCHRRLVAEWLEEALGIAVLEWGLQRDETIPYRHLPAAQKREQKRRQAGLF